MQLVSKREPVFCLHEGQSPAACADRPLRSSLGFSDGLLTRALTLSAGLRPRFQGHGRCRPPAPRSAELRVVSLKDSMLFAPSGLNDLKKIRDGSI